MTNSVEEGAVDFDNPFSYGTVVTGQDFTGREREIAELYISIKSRRNAVLYSDKRMGKSSVLAELMNRYSHEFVFVTMNLRGISDEGRFIELLTRETLKTAFAEVEELVPAIWELLNSARLRLAILEDGNLGMISRSETQAIILSPRKSSGSPDKSDDDLKAMEIRICPKCGRPLRWIEKYERHYCYGCKRYAPQKRTPRYSVGPSALTFPRRLCPECGNDLRYLEKFGEHYCDQCKKYPLMEQKSKRLVKPDQEEMTEALDLPEKIAMQKRKQFVIVFDDFQEMLSFDSAALLKAMRSRFELHTNVNYIFSGSGWNSLRREFADKDGVLYRFAHPVALGPLQKADLQEFLVKRFKAGGGKLAPAWASRIVELSAGHPYYSQMLGHELFHISRAPDRDDLEDAAKITVMRNAATYAAVWESIRSPLHRRFLLGTAMEPNVPHGNSFIRRYGLKSRSHVQRIEKQLGARGVTNSGEILDPFFTFWLRDIAST